MKKLTTFLLSSSLSLVIAFAPSIGMSAPLNGTTLDQISGVTFHFNNPDIATFKQMKSIGLGIGRTDLHWETVETTRGIYNFSVFDGLTNAMLTAGIRPMYILDFSNVIYEPPVTTGTLLTTTIKPPPIHAQSVAAFNNFAAAAAARYKGKKIIWEIWNEPNIQKFWPTGPNADQYADLAITTCWAIRNADPDATIIAPGLSGATTDFLKVVFARGLLDCIDGVSVHPYRSSNSAIPETVQADYDTLKALITQYAPPARLQKIALVNSEWGWSAAAGVGATYDQQANYLVRQKLLDMANGLGASIWYDWKNDGVDPTAIQQNFGIVDANGYAKLPYASMLNLSQQLNGMEFLGRVATASDHDYAFLFGNAQGAECLVSWTIDKAHSLKIVAPLVMQTASINMAQLGVNINNLVTASVTLALSSTPGFTILNNKP